MRRGPLGKRLSRCGTFQSRRKNMQRNGGSEKLSEAKGPTHGGRTCASVWTALVMASRKPSRALSTRRSLRVPSSLLSRISGPRFSFGGPSDIQLLPFKPRIPTFRESTQEWTPCLANPSNTREILLLTLVRRCVAPLYAGLYQPAKTPFRMHHRIPRKELHQL